MKTQWKRRASQTSLLALMVTMAFGAVGGASAADSGTETESQIAVKLHNLCKQHPPFSFTKRTPACYCNQHMNEITGSCSSGTDRVVDDLVRRLRRKLPELRLETVYGYGYRMVKS